MQLDMDINHISNEFQGSELDLKGNKSAQLNKFQFFETSLSYSTKTVYDFNKICANLTQGCSRIQVFGNFRQQITIRNQNASLSRFLLNLGSQLVFVTMFMRIVLYMLEMRYRNHIGDTIFQIEQARKGYAPEISTINDEDDGEFDDQ